MKQPIHLLTRLLVATMCEKLLFPYLSCSHTRITFRHSLVERTIVSHQGGECSLITNKGVVVGGDRRSGRADDSGVSWGGGRG